MKDIRRQEALESLAHETRCDGALFTTFTFDAKFFEHHVLANVLQVAADPDEAAAAYHDEAVEALKEIPIACFVDGTMRRPGHHLPYDLREIRSRCFHPKVALVLYGTFARLSVGSGNLTEAGYGGNAETFFVRDLTYADPDHASVLRAVAAFFDQLDEQATPRGTQTRQVLEHLMRRLPVAAGEAPEPPFAFLHTETEKPLLEQILELLPPNARIQSIGILAPFFERDDKRDDPAEELSSVLAQLSTRAGKQATFELGVAWEDASLGSPTPSPSRLVEGLNQLWGCRTGTPEAPDAIEYFTPIAETANSYRYIDERGRSSLKPKDQLDVGIADAKVWLVGSPRVFAPAALVEAARQRVAELSVWLYPTPQFLDERRVERPLHAKLLSLCYSTGPKRRTLVVVGSANASRMALLATPSEGGNVEACIAFIVDDELALRDLAPELVYCAAPVEWVEREFPEPPPLPAVPFISSAVYDARNEQLTVTWEGNPQMEVGTWALHYGDALLIEGADVPTTPSVFQGFHISPGNFEVIVRARDGELAFPILVEDLAALPVDSASRTLDLRELLAQVTRRLPAARRKAILEQHGPAMLAAALDGILGEGFAPTDVLKAWWTLAADLAADGLTLAGFRLHLIGAYGAAAIWRKIVELASSPGDTLRREEAWFYGVELRRELQQIEIPEGPDREPKRAELTAFLNSLRSDLIELQPSADERPWVNDVVQFYAEDVG